MPSNLGLRLPSPKPAPYPITSVVGPIPTRSLPPAEVQKADGRTAPRAVPHRLECADEAKITAGAGVSAIWKLAPDRPLDSEPIAARQGETSGPAAIQ